MSNDDKKILIDGQNNRYLIKKLTKTSDENKIRKDTIRWNSNKELFKHEKQLELLSDVYNEIFTQQEHLLVKKQLENKISSYRQQDIQKDKLNESEFVTIEHLLSLLYDSKLECHYCSVDVMLLYEIVREPYQWTLDRIDNDIGHNIGNLVISCLACNLNRRKTNKDAFLFTKKLKIIQNDKI